jgi:hypothetical protein
MVLNIKELASGYEFPQRFPTKGGIPQKHGSSILKWSILDDLGYPHDFGNLHMIHMAGIGQEPFFVAKFGEFFGLVLGTCEFGRESEMGKARKTKEMMEDWLFARVVCECL